jgi:hypothetical protein
VHEVPDLRRRLLSTREVAFMTKSARRLFSHRVWSRFKSQIRVYGRTPLPAEVIGQEPTHLLDPRTIDFYAAKTRVRIDKARRILDYQPAFDFSHGMRLTERWARWANLLGAIHPALCQPTRTDKLAAG